MGPYAQEDKSDTINQSSANNRFISLLSSSRAPWYDVPDTELISVEHPYIIKDIDKGIASLGGPAGLDELVRGDDGNTPVASLYQRPGNRLTKALYSHNVQTNNIMLKITLPKRTRVKRKRGSNETRQEDVCLRYSSALGGQDQHKITATDKDTPSLVRGLRDNPTKYQVEAIGAIYQTHRFRSLPDFVQSSTDSPFMQKMKDTILTFDYAKMKEFELDMSKGAKPNAEIIPPPAWSRQTVPLNYAYRQNPSVRSTIDAQGNLITRNTQRPPKVHALAIPFNSAQIPMAPPAELLPISRLEPVIQRLIATAQSSMERRPIFTRRSLTNCISGDEWQSAGHNVTKFLHQYVGYTFASGPWRDAIVKFGVDPRTDPKYRIYQTMMFLFDSESKGRRSKLSKARPERQMTEHELKRESHLFDGVNVSRDGKVWQVCDITDPMLRDLLATENLRKSCHLEGDGWYYNGTWAKAKAIMKWKITAILSGSEVLTDHNYLRVATALPDIIKRTGPLSSTLRVENSTVEEKMLASQIRATSIRHGTDNDNQLIVRDNYGGLESGPEVEGEGTLAEEEVEAQEMKDESEGEGVDMDEEPARVECQIDPNLEDPRVLEALRQIGRLEDGAM
ncbi:MAG: hypothetical protein Q9163_001851 [Psora crenata]